MLCCLSPTPACRTASKRALGFRPRRGPSDIGSRCHLPGALPYLRRTVKTLERVRSCIGAPLGLDQYCAAPRALAAHRNAGRTGLRRLSHQMEPGSVRLLLCGGLWLQMLLGHFFLRPVRARRGRELDRPSPWGANKLILIYCNYVVHTPVFTPTCSHPVFTPVCSHLSVHTPVFTPVCSHPRVHTHLFTPRVHTPRVHTPVFTPTCSHPPCSHPPVHTPVFTPLCSHLCSHPPVHTCVHTPCSHPGVHSLRQFTSHCAR
jgi:hypothetical protein